MSLIQVDQLNFKYSSYILKNVSFDLGCGCFVSLLGINGAGKSTLLKNLIKILCPESGAIYLDGEDVRRMRHREMARRAAYVSQYNVPVRNTVYDTILIGRLPHIRQDAVQTDYDHVEYLIRKLGLEKFAMRDANTLSGGEFQKVILARALAQEPKVLLLDEPTSSLDIKNQVAVMRLVREYCEEKQISVIVSIHDINLALRYSDKFLLLKDGAVYDYGGASVITRESIRDVYNLDVEVLNHGDKKFIILN